MPINLERAEGIGFEEERPPSYKYGTFTVLNKNKTPYFGSSLLEKGFYKCPVCREHSLKQILEWRCGKCQSKVIHWKCYTEEKEEKHIFYDLFIKNFEESVEKWRRAKTHSVEENKRTQGDQGKSNI